MKRYKTWLNYALYNLNEKMLYINKRRLKGCTRAGGSSEVLEDVPLRDLLPALLKHLVPVLHLHWSTLRTQRDLACNVGGG